uniref:Uncharacterized protein n=1 Tax=Anguilla anguilla TaxID=7936 RepID=A0A0E9UCT4_ANGAN
MALECRPIFSRWYSLQSNYPLSLFLLLYFLLLSSTFAKLFAMATRCRVQQHWLLMGQTFLTSRKP